MTTAGPRATIDLAALRANAALLGARSGGRAVIGVVKADAYGHGAPTVARTLLGAGCERLAVASVDELAELRSAGIAAPVLVLGPLASGSGAQRAGEFGATVVLHGTGEGELSLAREAAKASAAATGGGRPLPVHLEVDTGMHRLGVAPERATALASAIEAEAALSLEGVFTHFHSADEAELGPTLEQCARFRSVLASLVRSGLRPPLVHASNSAGVLAGDPIGEALPEANAVRPGLALYGVRPASHLAGDLAPVMTLRAPVVRIDGVPPGEGVGYGATWRAPTGGETRVATLAIGYADGVPWSTGNRGQVWLGGALRPIVGRVSMDSIGVDIGQGEQRPVSLGDEAILFGRDDDGGGLPIESAAASAGALHYELLVRVGRRVAREFF